MRDFKKELFDCICQTFAERKSQSVMVTVKGEKVRCVPGISGMNLYKKKQRKPFQSMPDDEWIETVTTYFENKEMKNNLYVNPGDVVRFNFWHYAVPKIFQTKVISVTPRYQHCNLGETKVGDLLEYVDPTSEETEYADVAYVEEIVERGQRRVMPMNIYSSLDRLPARGTAHDSINTLVSRAIGELDVKATTPVRWMDSRDIRGAWGVAWIGPGGVTVNVKPFRKWVAKNWSRLLQTTKSCDKERTDRNTEYEQDYWKQCEREMLEEHYGQG